MSNNIPTDLDHLTFTPAGGGAVDLQRSDLGIHLEVTKGYLDVVEVRGDDTIVPTADGRTARARVADRISIELTGWVQPVGATEALRLANFVTLRAALVACFDPTLDPGVLSGHNYAGTTVSITARALGDGLRWGPQVVPGVRPLVVLLESINASFWH